MPWTAASFKKKHNQALTTAQATKAAAQANAILRGGGSEGVAIAVANKHAHDKPKRRGAPILTGGSGGRKK